MTEQEAPLVQRVDLDAIAALDVHERLVRRLVDRATGGRHCMISLIRTPPGGGSPEGLHIHEVDQYFYILSGSMEIEIAGVADTAPAGTLVTFPAGVPHRNWNGGSEPTLHLSINAPLPPEGHPLAFPVESVPVR